MTGGAGADAFRFDSRFTTTNWDLIQDFKLIEGDRIELARSIFTAFGQSDVGMLSAGAFALSSGTKDANTRIIYNQVMGELFYDSDGSGTAKNPVLFAKINSADKPLLAHDSFFVI